MLCARGLPAAGQNSTRGERSGQTCARQTVATFAATGYAPTVNSAADDYPSEGKLHFLPQNLANAGMLNPGDKVQVRYALDASRKLMVSDVKPRRGLRLNS